MACLHIIKQVGVFFTRTACLQRKAESSVLDTVITSLLQQRACLDGRPSALALAAGERVPSRGAPAAGAGRARGAGRAAAVAGGARARRVAAGARAAADGPRRRAHAGQPGRQRRRRAGRAGRRRAPGAAPLWRRGDAARLPGCAARCRDSMPGFSNPTKPYTCQVRPARGAAPRARSRVCARAHGAAPLASLRALCARLDPRPACSVLAVLPAGRRAHLRGGCASARVVTSAHARTACCREVGRRARRRRSCAGGRAPHARPLLPVHGGACVPAGAPARLLPESSTLGPLRASRHGARARAAGPRRRRRAGQLHDDAGYGQPAEPAQQPARHDVQRAQPGLR